MEDNINVFGELEALPKDMKFIVMTNLDAQSLGRLMQTNKSFNKLPNETGIWKYKCLTTWKLSPENLKKVESIAATVNWRREYRVLTYYSRRIYNNQMQIRSDDAPFVRSPEDPNALEFYSDQAIDAIAVQSKFKFYPLPIINFGVAYYELTVEELNEKEPTIGIGFALHRYIRAFPGWGKDSYGLHGDNGHFYNQRSFGMHRCDVWAVGDTIGFGINYAKKEIFLTRNGVLVSVLAKKVRNLMHMYATIGLRAQGNKCRVNFGQTPFEFDIEYYLRNLEAEQQFTNKWPMKLYSQIIQEIENSMLDDESLEDVEEELIGGVDYNEKPAEQPKTEQPKEQQNEHKDHVHGENRDHQGEHPDETEGQEDMHRKHKEYIEWLFNRLAGLENEVAQQAIAENSPDIREITLRIVEGLQFNIDPNLPLEELVQSTRIEMIGFMSAQYHSYLLEEKALRTKREAANPALKKRTLIDMDIFWEENRLLFLVDKTFPNNHPLIVSIVRQLSLEHNIAILDLNNITYEDRVETVLMLAYRYYCARRFMELEAKRIQRRKENEKERHEKLPEFETIFGKDSFVPFASAENMPKSIDEDHFGVPTNFPVSEDDLCNATEFCSMKYYGGILHNPRLGPTNRILLEALDWWMCVPEVPIQPEDSIEEFRSRCVKIAEEKVAYYEDDRARCESVIRGSIALLRTKSISENDRLIVVVLLGWVEMLLTLMHETHEISNEELSIELIKQLSARLEDMDKTFQELQDSKKEMKERKLLAQRKAAENEAKNNNNNTNNNDNTKTTKQSGSNNVPLIAAASVAVAIVGAAFVYFRNKWRK